MADQKQESVEKAAQPQLCVNNCGFFANIGCNGLCSKCHKDILNEEDKKRAASEVVELAKAKVAQSIYAPKPILDISSAKEAARSVSLPCPLSSSETQLGQQLEQVTVSEASSPSAKVSTRCQQCKRKVGLTGFKCKCGQLFCGQHRYAESHSCTFDYKASERQKLIENNPVVQASKVQKI